MSKYAAETCPKCNGRGQIQNGHIDIGTCGYKWRFKTCDYCYGGGYICTDASVTGTYKGNPFAATGGLDIT